MGDIMSNAGFVIFNSSDVDILKLDGARGLYDVDDFLRNFKDENDFRLFLKNIMKVSNVDNSDVFIYSRGQSKKRFSDLLFNKKSREYHSVLDKILAGDEVKYSSLLKKSYKKYKTSPKYRLLFDSSFNNCYVEYRELVRNHYLAGHDSIQYGRKLNWLLGDLKAYNNFRDLVYLRDVLFSVYNTKMDKVKDLCKQKSEINRLRESSRDVIENKIKDATRSIDPEVVLPIYEFYKNAEEMKKQDDLTDDVDLDVNSNKDFVGQMLDEVDESDKFDLSSIDFSNLSQKELLDRKQYVLDILLNESYFPRKALVFFKEPVIMYFDTKKLPTGFDDEMISNLSEKMPFDFLMKLSRVKSHVNRYNEFKDIEGDTYLFKKEMYSKNGSMTDIDNYLDELIHERNSGSERSDDFDNIYLLAKACEDAKMRRDAKKDESDGKERVKK